VEVRMLRFVCRVGPCIAGLLLALLPTVASAGATCPQSCIWIGFSNDYCTTAAVVDTVIDPVLSGHQCANNHEGHFDVPHGTLSAQGGGSLGTCYPKTTVEDDFTVIGLPNGTPVDFFATLIVTAVGFNAMSGGHAQGTIEGPGPTTDTVVWQIDPDLLP